MRQFWQLAAFLGALFILSSCNLTSGANRNESGQLRLRSVSYSSLPGWAADDHAAALEAFLISCTAINRRAGGEDFGPSLAFGKVRDWQRACRAADRVPSGSSRLARAFFEGAFQPFSVMGQGTFTGYYEVSVRGSRQRTGPYQFPVYARPSDLSSRSPYYTRAQIDRGALNGRGLELLYLPTAADAFLLHVQGSGAIALTDGTTTRISFAGSNGHSFRSISQALAAAGYDQSREGATMVDYRRWLNQNPSRAVSVVQANPRYIFFAEHDKSGPVGAQGVPLSAGRSLAVDRDHLALGVPIYIDTRYADPNRNDARRDLHRLVIAQDTGTAINGTVRGDFYWGTGETALNYAGRMKEDGRYTLLLPR